MIAIEGRNGYCYAADEARVQFHPGAALAEDKTIEHGLRQKPHEFQHRGVEIYSKPSKNW